MTREELENLWKDPRNRKWGVYYCKEDPRVVVPKSIRWFGWTVNAARPSAIPVAVLLLVILGGPVWFAAFHRAGIGVVLLTAAASIAVVCLVCAYLASRTS